MQRERSAGTAIGSESGFVFPEHVNRTSLPEKRTPSCASSWAFSPHIHLTKHSAVRSARWAIEGGYTVSCALAQVRTSST